MAAPVIARLRPGDGVALQALHGLFRAQDGQIATERFEEMLRDQRNLFFAAVQGKQPVGWAIAFLLPRFRNNEMFLYELNVVAQARRTTAARGLVAAVAQAARAEGCPEVYTLTEANNAAAKRLYESAGLTRERPDNALYVLRLNN